MGWLLIVIAALVGHGLWYGFMSDDAYITARYARNVAEGQGWVFNIGERVEGYTSFLWVALAAGLHVLGVDASTAVRALSLLGAIGCAVALFFGGAKLLGAADGQDRPWRAAIAPGLLAVSGSFACWSLGGLEACGYALAILAPILILGDGEWTASRAALAGVAAGVCALVRPDGVLVIAAVGACLLVLGEDKRFRITAAYAIPALAITLAHLLWRRAYYGDWLPNTYYVKVGSGWPVYRRGIDYLVSGLADNGGLALWLVPLAAPWFMAGSRWARTASAVALTLLAGVVYVGGDGLPMHRFIVPIMPLWLLLLSRLVLSLYDAGARAGRPVAVAIIVIGGASLFCRSEATQQYATYLEHRGEVPDWEVVGKWLADNTAPDATIACAPIGAVGYFSRLHVYDMLGLTDKHIARKVVEMGHGWAGHEKHDGPYILSRKPTYLLLGNIQIVDHALPMNSPYFVRPPSAAVRAREGDIFVPELFQNYRPRIEELPGGRFFHFLQRAEAEPESNGLEATTSAPSAP